MSDPTPGVISITTPSPGRHADPAVETPAAAPDSPLGSLRERRAKMVEDLWTDIRVPRWGDNDGGPKLYVRFKPASPSEHAARFEKLQKQAKKPADWAVDANAQVLVSCCVGIYAVEGEPPADGEDDRPKLSLRDGDPHGPWTKFDPDLGNSLGLDAHAGAVSVCRALYFTEADITSTANRLMEWSGISMQQSTTDFFAS